MSSVVDNSLPFARYVRGVYRTRAKGILVILPCPADSSNVWCYGIQLPTLTNLGAVLFRLRMCLQIKFRSLGLRNERCLTDQNLCLTKFRGRGRGR